MNEISPQLRAMTASIALLLGALALSRTGVAAQCVAIVCTAVLGISGWLILRRSSDRTKRSIDVATTRVLAAVQGDLSTPTPCSVTRQLPDLSQALDSLFRQVGSKLESANALALFDPVTALANRTNFRAEAERIIAELPDTTQAALVFIDLDHFKVVNDTLGHAQGDRLLAMVAARLRHITDAENARRGRDMPPAIVGRLAGDEFTIFLPQIADESDGRRIAHALLDTLMQPFDLSGHLVHVGASLGIAVGPGHGRTLTALMRAADVAMYHAKDQGRGQFQFYTEALAEKVADRALLEHELRTAIAGDELEMVYQPQVSLTTGEVVAAEALLRWNHPTDGVRVPASFIDIAEESGLIHALGDWATDAAAKALARWPSLGIGGRMSVNLSLRQMMRADYFPSVHAALERHGVPAERLELELGESAAMECGAVAIREIKRLRALGATVTIDGFGSGCSNLTRLRELPLDRIKIDRSLISDVAHDDQVRAIVQALLALIHGLGCLAVAEGVETDAQIAVLHVMGCDVVQGYGVAMPMTERDYVAWTKTRSRMRA